MSVYSCIFMYIHTCNITHMTHQTCFFFFSGVCAGWRYGFREAGASVITEASHCHSNTWEVVEIDERG